MNKQRKVVITITYNEMGIIVDTNAEEVAQTNLQPTCNQLATDVISRKAALDGIADYLEEYDGIDENGNHDLKWCAMKEAELLIKDLPSAQPEVPDINVGDIISIQAAIEGLPSVQQEHKWETCFDCPLSHGCPKIKGCTNEQAIEYASQIPNDCPLSAQPDTYEALRTLDAIHSSGRLDYGDYCDLHDAISEIGE